MQFHEFATMYDVSRRLNKQLGIKKDQTAQEHYAGFKSVCVRDLADPTTNKKDVAASFNQCLAEADFIADNRPYYNVYPTITKYLINLKEDKVPVNLIKLPHRVVAFRFATTETAFNFEDNGITYGLRTAFVSYTNQDEILKVGGGKIENDMMIIWMDFGEEQTVQVSEHETVTLPVYTYKILHVNTNKTLEEAINDSKKGGYDGLQIPDNVVTNIIRCIASCCLISRDLEDGLIEPDVLTKDREKYRETHDQKYVDKAIRRGKHGFLVGADLVVSPHWRSGSPLALYWTGPGRTIPLYRTRKGAIIHRKKVKELPSGYDHE